MKGTQDIIQQALRVTLLSNIASPGDPIIITSGVMEAHSGSTNLLQIMHCPSLDDITPIDGFFCNNGSA